MTAESPVVLILGGRPWTRTALLDLERKIERRGVNIDLVIPMPGESTALLGADEIPKDISDALVESMRESLVTENGPPRETARTPKPRA